LSRNGEGEEPQASLHDDDDELMMMMMMMKLENGNNL